MLGVIATTIIFPKKKTILKHLTFFITLDKRKKSILRASGSSNRDPIFCILVVTKNIKFKAVKEGFAYENLFHNERIMKNCFDNEEQTRKRSIDLKIMKGKLDN